VALEKKRQREAKAKAKAVCLCFCKEAILDSTARPFSIFPALLSIS
jgi:hypothetical protein